MTVPPSQVWWIHQLGRFARFLTILRKRGSADQEDLPHLFDPRFAKIFFSSIHLVPSGVQVYEKLKAVAENGGQNVRLLSVQEPPDEGFKELILARLWLSDAVLGILPRNPERFDGTSGNYRWIGKETALALLTRTSVALARESGANSDSILADFGSIDDDLFPWADKAEAIGQLRQHFKDHVVGEFAVTDPSRPLDDRLKDQLERLVKRALDERTDKLVRGFLNQFSPDLLANLEFLQRARSGVQATWLAGVLKHANRIVFDPEDEEDARKKKAEQKFRTLYKGATSRALVLNHQPYSLMRSAKRGKGKLRNYYWSLPSILKELRPWATPAEVLQWENEVLAWAIKRGEDGLRRRGTQ